VWAQRNYTRVVMKCSVFWDITLCRLVKTNRRFVPVSRSTYSSTLKISPQKYRLRHHRKARSTIGWMFIARC
jgi:hypothetical protein